MLRIVLAAMLLSAWPTIEATAADRPGRLAAPLFTTLGAGVTLAQDSQGGARSRMLGPARGPGPDWKAAKAAQSCAAGGQILKVDPTGNGYNVLILKGSEAVIVRVDQNGNCN